MHTTLLPCLLAIAFFTTAVAQPSLIRSGPMVGHVDQREANIWLQTTQPANVRIVYRDSAAPTRSYTSASARTNDAIANTVTIKLDSVEPATTYLYDVYVNDVKHALPYPTQFRTQAVWRWRPAGPPTVRIAMGSCTYVNEERFDRPGTPYGSDYGIFTSIAAAKPDVMVWLGDNTYTREADWNSRTGFLHRYTHTRSLPELQPLLARTANYAIWDDHDYGPNDSDRGFWGKSMSLEIFKAFWANPSAGVMDKPGITTSFEIADAQFFLLDDRYYRAPNDRTDGERTILGEHQIQWLIDALSTSTATFKFVCVGSQFLTDNLRKECFSRMPEERQRIINEITTNRISGVIFLTGDIHATELSKLDRPGTYPLYEFTCSSLTAGSNKGIKDQSNAYRVAGTEYGLHNFGIATLSGPEKDRTLTITVHDANGTEVWTRSISARELR